MAEYSPNGQKSAADLEREVEMQRARLSDTIDEIQTKLSPGQIVDQLMDFTKGGANEFAANLGRGMKDNPLPVALLGLSLFWLMSGKNPASGLGGGGSNNVPHGRYQGGRYKGVTDYEPYYDDLRARPGVRGKISEAADGLRDAVGGIKDAVGGIKDAAAGIGDKVSGLAASAGDAYNQAGERIGGLRDDLEGPLGDARHRLHDVRDDLSHRAHDLRDQVSGFQSSAMTMLKDQPLIAGALAFAAGAALAAALPVSAKEKELLGETAAEVKDTVLKAAEPYIAQGKDLLDDAVATGKGALDDAVTSGKAALKDAKTTLTEGYDDLKKTVVSSVEGETGNSSGGTPTI